MEKISVSPKLEIDTIAHSAEATTADKSLLIVDDDAVFSRRVALEMEERGYSVKIAFSVNEAKAAIIDRPPAFAVIDMRFSDGNGLDVVSTVKEARSDARAIVLSGYGDVGIAVRAIKQGAFDWLIKPSDADCIHGALTAKAHDKACLPEHLMSADRVRWEHIQRTYASCNFNVSVTARRLAMHRRTLQRILAKRAPR